MGKSNVELRKDSKKQALKWLELGNMDMTLLAAKLSEYNGWRKQTNRNILQELVDVGKLERKQNLIFAAGGSE